MDVLRRLVAGLRKAAPRLLWWRRRPAPVVDEGPATIPYSDAGSDPIATPDGMVGRQAEAERLAAALRDHPVVVVHGPARIGKTWLCQRCAAQWRETDRPFWYACPLERGIGELYERLARFFRANGWPHTADSLTRPEANDDDRAATVAGALHEDSFLIVLDSFDAVAHREPFQALVQAVVDRQGKGRLLLVARRPPEGFLGLVADALAGVEVPMLSPADVDALAAGLGCSKRDRRALAGRAPLHPFALQLVVQLAQVREESPADILASMPADRLETGAISLLYDRLPERDVLDRLSVLRAPFAAAAFPAFGGTPELPERADVALLLEPTPGSRLQLHPVVREHALVHLREQPDQQTLAHEQAVEYYGSLGSDTGRAAALALCERAHHLLVLDRAHEALLSLAAEARRIVSFGLGWTLLLLTRQIESAGLLDGEPSEEQQALHLRELAALYVHLPVASVDQNRLRAIRYCGRAAETYRQRDVRLGLAETLNLLGMALSSLPSGDVRRNIQRAMEGYQEAQLLFQDLGANEGRVMVHNNMAAAWMKLAEVGGEDCVRRAVSHLRLAVRLFGVSADTYFRALVSRNLGNCLCQLGRVEEGMTHFGEAVKLFALDAYPREYGSTQQDMGDAHRLMLTGRRSFRLQQALTYYAEATRIREQEIFPEDFAQTQMRMGIAHYQLAIHEGPNPHHRLSVKCYQNALRVYTAEEFPHYNERILGVLGREGVGAAATEENSPQ